MRATWRATCSARDRPSTSRCPGPRRQELHHLVLRGRLRETGTGRLRTNSEAVPAPGQPAVRCRAGAVQKTAKHAPGRRKNDRQNSEPDKRTPPQDARYLVDNFDVILLPDFKTSGMVTRSQRRIRSKTVRNLLSFAHHRFRNFLRHKGFGERQDSALVNEAYTSKTVSWTGEINHTLGGRKTVSSTDGRRMDRDHNWRTADIPARFGRYPLPETARLRVRCNKPQCLLAN